MAPPKALGMYADIKTLFDLVLAQGAVSKVFPSPSTAKHFRQRCYYFRKLLHLKQLEALGVSIANTSTPYDSIKIIITTANPCLLRIQEVIYDGGFVFDSGLPVVALEVTSVEDIDPLLADAMKLFQDLSS